MQIPLFVIKIEKLSVKGMLKVTHVCIITYTQTTHKCTRHALFVATLGDLKKKTKEKKNTKSKAIDFND